MGTLNRTQARLEEEQKARGVAEPSIAEDAVIAALPPRERHIFDVTSANLAEGYILFEIIGQRCPMAMSLLDDEGRRALAARFPSRAFSPPRGEKVPKADEELLSP